MICKYKILLDVCSFKESQYSFSNNEGVLVNYYTIILQKVKEILKKSNWVREGVMFALRELREVGLIKSKGKLSEPPRVLS